MTQKVAAERRGALLARPDGYVYVRVPGRRTVAEHVLIAEGVLGRRLKAGECVHHINGDKADNRRQNLLICDSGYHRWLHARMSFLYQRERFTGRG